MNIFDILGPVMVGPSSSHTAGAVRIGLIARRLLGGQPATAKITLQVRLPLPAPATAPTVRSSQVCSA